MEPVSVQSSPKKPVSEKPESPVLPPQHVVSAASEKMAENQQQSKPEGSRSQVKTPEPRAATSKERIAQNNLTDRSPSTPGHLAPFDWDDFEARYQEALGQADAQERELIEEFHGLVEYFVVWAETASKHDTERAVKRLQTRERYVKIAEQSLSQKKKHLTEVVRAFQSALALLSQS
ncbi:hypothetical protein QBC47DRAFT_156282 [Echria macrotheca]|uniref:Uncharacterized protein n=1 Tax=Echria macrotheca TaxID=438768 RepID=A0AAJ0F6Z9_9PEZI|nr:hypothetical protein QBC47DRAFT_156282 [Echria macrotheca]